MSMQQHTLIALLQDRPGVLNRAVSLFRRRGFNIASLAVGQSEVPGVSRMTLVVDREHVEQVVKQLDRLIEVLAVHDVTHERTVEQETCLVKVTAPSPSLAELVSIAAESHARVVEVSAAVMILVLTDAPERVAVFVERLRPFGILELIRSGRIAMALGASPARLTERVTRPETAQRATDGGPGRPYQWQADGASDTEAA
jgi:acetolactate synthase I/III small subunit